MQNTIRLSEQSIVHLTAQIQNMETRVAKFFWGCRGPYFGPTNTINTKHRHRQNVTSHHSFSHFIFPPAERTNTKITKKTLAGPFLRKPPKMHCNAPQCTAM